MAENTSNYSNLFKKIGGMFFEIPNNPPTPNTPQTATADSQPTKNATSSVGSLVAATTMPNVKISSTLGNEDVQKVVDKLYQYLKTINEQGIDFMEYWDALNGIDASKPENYTTIFKVINITSNNQLSKENLLSSGKKYAQKLSDLVNNETQKSELDLQTISKKKEHQRSTLLTEVQQKEHHLAELQKEIEAKKIQLATIDTQFQPEIETARQKIFLATKAAEIVINDLNNTVSNIEKFI